MTIIENGVELTSSLVFSPDGWHGHIWLRPEKKENPKIHEDLFTRLVRRATKDEQKILDEEDKEKINDYFNNQTEEK